MVTLKPFDYEAKFMLSHFPPNWVIRYKATPTQPVAVVRDPKTRTVEMFRWGLIPSWAKDPALGSRMINARAETLTEKPSFRNAFQKRRCLILADGFYEWEKIPGRSSKPHLFKLVDSTPFMFAGLWEFWTPPGKANPILSCTIITTTPNTLIAPIHDRMPVMLDPEQATSWISDLPPRDLQSLLVPYPTEAMQETTINSLFNNPAINSPS